ncbi:MAG: N-acetylmuramoyl-L-alanine amidase [Bacteroidales bacterium]|nr:N-acetylmuramoyl-L-alanine amidase [Bacteroidales bacterium]
MKRYIFSIVAMLAIAAPQAFAGWDDYVIVLDPGHGGDDCGAVYNGGRTGSESYESYLAMNCARGVYNKLTSHGAEVHATRSLYDDDFAGEVNLSPRRAYCYTYGSDVFISFHLNAANASAHGTETWYSANYSPNSLTLAKQMQTALVDGDHGFATVDGRGGYDLIDRGVKYNDWTVITAGNSYPAVLTEGLFIDCYSDWQLIKSANTADPGFAAWVDGHLNGIYNYLYKYGNLVTTDETGLYYAGGGSEDAAGAITITGQNATDGSQSVVLSCKVGESVSHTVKLSGANLNHWTTAEVCDAAKAIGVTISQNGFAVDGDTHQFNPKNPELTITFTPKSEGSWVGQWYDNHSWYSSPYFVHLVCPEDAKGEQVQTWINLQCIATAPAATITPSVTDLEFNCRLGESVSKTIQLYGAGLASNVAINAANGSAYGISVDKSQLTVNTSTGTFTGGSKQDITITFTPKAVTNGTITKAVTFTATSKSGTTLVSGLNITCRVEAPAITANNTSVSLVCPTGQSVARDVPLSAFGLTGNATAKLSAAAKSIGISMTDGSGNADAQGNVSLAVQNGTFSDDAQLKLRFKPTGAFDESSTAYYITISAPSLAGTATTKIQLHPSLSNLELPLTEGWNFSDKNGNAIVQGANGEYDAKLFRNITYHSDRLYGVYDHKKIRVLDARDNGRLLYDLNSDGISGGAVALADVKAFDGKIIASNIVVTSTTEKTLKIYVWDSPTDRTAKPRVMNINVSRLFSVDYISRIGDYIDVDGTWANGRLVVTAIEQYDGKNYPIIYEYAVKNGAIAATPISVEPYTGLDADGAKKYLACGASTRAIVAPFGYYLCGPGMAATKVAHNHATMAEGLVADQMINFEHKYTSVYRQFEYPDKNGNLNTYAFILDYAAPEYNASGAMVAGTSYRGGNMKLLRVQNAADWNATFKQPVVVGTFPNEGLSDTLRNINGTGNVCVNTNNQDYLEAWVMSTGQGMAYYRLGKVPGQKEYDVSDVTALINAILIGNTDTLPDADHNGDGEVNVTDVTTLINKILSK